MPATFPCHSDDFCITHGREHMRSRMGDPIPFCQACEDDKTECEHPWSTQNERGGYCQACGGTFCTDAEEGMNWWNSLDDKARKHWMKAAGDTGRAVDAWLAFKASRKPRRGFSDPMFEQGHDSEHDRARNIEEAAERRCQKCGCPTKYEEAWIDGEIWCHPCADDLADQQEPKP